MDIIDPVGCHEPHRRRAAPSAPSLTAEDAGLIKGMLDRGDAQQWIAQWFRQNQARVAEIARGAMFPEVRAADEADLPPRGPYPTPVAMMAVREAIELVQAALDRAGTLISNH